MRNENQTQSFENIENEKDLRVINKLLVDYQVDQKRSNKRKDIIIIILIICMAVEALGFYGGFVWYESQFETVTTEEIQLETEGENASINNVSGDQYNDESQHVEGK